MTLAQQIELFVPGRVCLFGEHSDWAGAYRSTHPHIPAGETLICGTNTGIYARAAAHDDRLVLRSVVDGREISAEIPTDLDTLLQVAQSGNHWSYIAGVAYQVRSKYDVGGLNLDNYLTDLPVQKGLSSSAAISVLTARAFNYVYDLGMTVQEEMELAYQGEITTPSQCGRMDQGCAFGQVPIKMTFDGDALHVAPIDVRLDLHLVLVDLCAHKDTRRILDDLHACYPDADSATAVGLRKLLGEINQDVVRKAARCLSVGDARGLGELMTSAQELFDRYARPACPSELNSPVLHGVLADERIAPFVWGGKGIGSQGDGSAQFVARSHADQQALVQLINDAFGMHAMPMTIRPNFSQLATSFESVQTA